MKGFIEYEIPATTATPIPEGSAGQPFIPSPNGLAADLQVIDVQIASTSQDLANATTKSDEIKREIRVTQQILDNLLPAKIQADVRTAITRIESLKREFDPAADHVTRLQSRLAGWRSQLANFPTEQLNREIALKKLRSENRKASR
jgi:hypothetical protein